MILTATDFLALMDELAALKTVTESFSYEMSGGRFTRLTVRRGKDRRVDQMTVRAELFDNYTQTA